MAENGTPNGGIDTSVVSTVTPIVPAPVVHLAGDPPVDTPNGGINSAVLDLSEQHILNPGV